MAIKIYKPTSPGRRGMSVSTSRRSRDAAGAIARAGLRKRAGRNNEGRVTVRHRGGGHKRLLPR